MTPFILRSQAILQANSSTEVESDPLMNPSGDAMEIHQFKFSVRPSDAAIQENKDALKIAVISGGQIGVSLEIKDEEGFGYPLTAGAVPLWSFGKAEKLGEESVAQVLFSNPAQNDWPLITNVASYSFKLDFPMYLPPNARIHAKFHSLGGFTSEAQVGISAIGKIMPCAATQGSFKVPWVSSYLSRSFNFDEVGTDTDVTVLRNPHDKPLNVTKFVGRLHMRTVSPAQNIPTLGEPSAVSYVDDVSSSLGGNSIGGILKSPAAWFSQTIRLQMTDSAGHPIIREPTLFRAVFEPVSRVWETKHVLTKKQFYKTKIAKSTLPDVILSSGVSTAQCQASVTMVGWREVSWQKGSN